MRVLRKAKKRAKAMEVSGCGGKVNGVIGQDELKQGKRPPKSVNMALRYMLVSTRKVNGF